MIVIVSATRASEEGFWNQTALGISLRRLQHDARLTVHVAFNNRRGLPHIYNDGIAVANPDDTLIFIHDDVWIDDYFLGDRVLKGLESYDVLGVAGNRRRVHAQPGWLFVDAKFTRDERSNLSGAVAHGEQPFGQVAPFGPVPSDCELLDGVFLAVKASTLKEKSLRFDPRFEFHFYDLDFCRSAREHGLRLGTWPICLTHQSGGAFGTPSWTEGYRVYLDKWKS